MIGIPAGERFAEQKRALREFDAYPPPLCCDDLQLSSVSCATEGVMLALYGRLECSGEYSITQEDIDSGIVSGNMSRFSREHSWCV